jgi:hypothetical protein
VVKGSVVSSAYAVNQQESFLFVIDQVEVIFLATILQVFRLPPFRPW